MGGCIVQEKDNWLSERRYRKIEKRKTFEEAIKSDLVGVARWTYFLRLFVTISYEKDKDAWYFELIPAAWYYPGTRSVNWNADVADSLHNNEWNFSSKDRIKKIIPFKEVRKFINGEFKNLFKKMQGADLKQVFNPACVGIGEKYEYAFKNFKTGKIEFTNNENYYE